MFKFFKPALLLLVATLAQHAAAVNFDKLERDSWTRLSSKNFVIVTDLNEEEGRHVIEEMETFRYFARRMAGIKALDGIKPLKILAISKNGNFNALDLEENILGIFSVDAAGYAAIANVSEYRSSMANGNLARHVLLHEYQHFLLRFSEDPHPLPLWYDEGMAEYWATFKFDGKKIYIGDADGGMDRSEDLVDSVGKIALDTKELFKLTSLPKSENSLGAEIVAGIYSQAYYVVHYFNSSAKLRASLKDYLKYVNAGFPPAKALNLAFGMSFEQLDDNVLTYIRKSLSMREYSLEKGDITFPKFEVSASPLDKAGLYRELVDIVPKFTDHASDIALLKRDLALNPNDLEASIALLRNKELPNAKEVLAGFENTSPNHPTLLVYKGDQLLSEAEEHRKAGAEDWITIMKQARGMYRRAVKADPLSSLGYLGLGEVYRYMPASEPLQEGIVGLESASLFERSGSTHALLANFYFRMNKPLEALPALRDAVAFAHETGYYAMLLDNMEMLNDVTKMQGTLTDSGYAFASGAVYTGKLADGKPDGAGKILRPNGSYFEGKFANGIMQGQGKIVTHTEFQYVGDFSDGVAYGDNQAVVKK